MDLQSNLTNRDHSLHQQQLFTFAFIVLSPLLVPESSQLAQCRDDCDNDDPWCADASCLPVKWAGLAVPNPSLAADANYEESTLSCSHVLAAFQGVDTFRSAKHKSVIVEVKTELKLRNKAK
jgi:hypothetical protein